tara:strand:- start:2478 stop:3095 length:618 start_codon:yes stop_codon:yes gene_type:complete
MYAKICGIKDHKTLHYLLNHKYPPKFIGFICNYPKSKRHLEIKDLEKLLDIKKKKHIKFVSVLVNPNKFILNKIRKLNFDYLQLYDVNPENTLKIKREFGVKIITAITVKNINDVMKYKKYKNISEIILFDSKGYEKSLSFDHKLLKNISDKITIMLAGNIQYDDKLDNFRKITHIIDLSGSLETNGKKDVSKINIFLQNIKKLK